MNKKGVSSAIMRIAAIVLPLLLGWPLAHAADLRLATTTSTANTGLLDFLFARYKGRTGVIVRYVAVGTGAALKIGEQGDADLVLVHARQAEDRFVAAGFGVNRRDLMYNDFIVLGPPADPAAIKGEPDAAAALKRIRTAGASFVSRGDQSGTHIRELELWKAAGVEPKWAGYYLSIGQGMGTALVMAFEKRGYVLSDRGTFLAYRGKLDLQVMVEGDKRLLNPYGIIAVNPARYPRVNFAGAMRLIDWLTSSEGQQLIAGFKANGAQLFFPSAR
jgi:tungstate transport system substrate-binding protein